MWLSVRGQHAYAYTGGKTFDPSLPTVVFIHGAQHDHSVWILQSRYLAHHGYGVLALDLPGHVKSSGAPLASVEDMAAWVVALLDAAGVKTAILVGHSMGSLIAIETAGAFPERVSKVALVGTAVPMRVGPDLLNATRTCNVHACCVNSGNARPPLCISTTPCKSRPTTLKRITRAARCYRNCAASTQLSRPTTLPSRWYRRMSPPTAIAAQH